MSSENVKLIHQWVETANRQDGEALADLYHDDGVYRSPFGSNEGKDSIRAAFLQIFDITPDLITDIINLVADGDQVAIDMVAYGTNVKPHPAVPGSQPGLKLYNHGVHWFKIRDGKIATDTAFYDKSLMFRD